MAVEAWPSRIEVLPGVLLIEWDDGQRSEIDARTLRRACPCAACRDPSGAEAAARIVDGLLAVTVDDVRVIGDYALGMRFSPDGHATGIFPYSLLRTLPSSTSP